MAENKSRAPSESAGLQPTLAREWHPTKNGELVASDLPPFSHRKVWWICEKGHEWQADIRSRTLGKGCPYCTGKKIGSDNSLAAQFPTLAKEWHQTKNGDLSPSEVAAGSNKKVWWKCARGHEWQAQIFSRSRGARCPACSGRKVGEKNCLAVTYPKLVEEWNGQKNGAVDPSGVMPGSSMKVWWQCEKGHQWMASIRNRARGSGCPYCSGAKAGKENSLAVLRPDIASEWHPTKNETLTSGEVTSGSGRKVWWQCENGHEWIALVSSRTRGTGCPFCAGLKIGADNNLAVVLPQLAAEWNAVENGELSPTEVGPKSSKQVWWICTKGHKWKASIKDRARGTGCPYCSGKKLTPENNFEVVFPALAKDWHPSRNDPLKPSEVMPHSTIRVWWKCKQGHEWRTTVGKRVNGSACPVCMKKVR
jgi:hypothetical protein